MEIGIHKVEQTDTSSPSIEEKTENHLSIIMAVLTCIINFFFFSFKTYYVFLFVLNVISMRRTRSKVRFAS